MKLALVGVGNAGSRVVNQILAAEQATGRNLTHGNTLLVNATPPSFSARERVPEDRRLMLGDVYWDVDDGDMAADPDVAAEVALEEHNDLNRAFDLLEFHEVDGILVVAGLASGFGGGAGAVVIHQLQAICDEPIYGVGILPTEDEGPQAALNAARSLQSFVKKADNVITFDNETWLENDRRATQRAAPNDGESPATQPASAESNEPTTRRSDGLSLEEELAGAASEPEASSPTDTEETSSDADSGSDTDDGGSDDGAGFIFGTDLASSAASGGETDAESDPEQPGHEIYERVNEILAERLVILFAAGEFGGRTAPETRLDPSDIMRTLDTGGVSSIGYASNDLQRPGLFGRWLRAIQDRLPWVSEYDPEWSSSGAQDDVDEATDARKLNQLVRRAVASKLTLPCEIESADRALIILSGPSRVLSRKGFESGRYWLEKEADIVDVMAGDAPHDRADALTAVVLFSNVTDVPRIEAMQELALEHEPILRTTNADPETANPP